MEDKLVFYVPYDLNIRLVTVSFLEVCIKWPKGREGSENRTKQNKKPTTEWTRNSYCICTQNPSSKTSVNATEILKSKYGTLHTFEKLKKGEKEKKRTIEESIK